MGNRDFRGTALEILADRQYSGVLPGIFRDARRSINVCMFHIAFPNDKHPTFKLLQGLSAAKKRGVKVQVLVDKDRLTDPYKSAVINRRAVQYLRKAGVLCKYDQVERLLHSKFITVDGRETVIGSHNWTAGSYFTYHDVSFRILSRPYTGYMERRFSALWRQGTSVD